MESEVAADTELNGLCHLLCFRSKTKDVLVLSYQGFPEHLLGSQYIFNEFF